jgi:hypothetical protein
MAMQNELEVHASPLSQPMALRAGGPVMGKDRQRIPSHNKPYGRYCPF